jgi:hypothetical protein
MKVQMNVHPHDWRSGTASRSRLSRFTPIYGVDTEGPSFSWSLNGYCRFILAERLLTTVRAKHDESGIVDAAAERGCKLMAGMST